MRVACETPSIATARLVCELKAEGEDEREHEFDERLAIAKQLKVGRFILKINSDGPVFAGLTGGVAHGSPSGQMVVADDDLRWGRLHNCKGITRGVGAPPLNSVECGVVNSSHVKSRGRRSNRSRSLSGLSMRNP